MRAGRRSPRSSGPGEDDVCLVFLAPNKGDLTAVSFRPTQDYDPITWTGELEKPEAEPARASDKGDKGNGNNGN